MSLTTTTVRTLGSFQLISTKTTPIRAPPKKQKRKSSVHRQKGPSPNYASSLLSMESDLDSVLEEDDYYPTSNNNRLSLALPNISDDSNGTTLTSPRISHHHISFSPQASIESDVIEKHRPPPRGVSPMKSALKSDHSHNGSIASNINSEEYPHVYLSTSNTMKRQSKVSFSSNDAINEFNAHHPPSASLAASQNYYPQSPARSAALGATSDPSGVHPSQQRASTGAKYTYDSVAHEVSKRTSNSSVGPSSPKQRHTTPSSPTLVPPKTRSSARPPAAKSKALAVNSNKKSLKKSSSQQAPSSYQNSQTENEIYNFTYDDDNDSSSGDSIYSDASDFPMPIYGPNTPSYYDSSSSPLSSKPKATSSSPSHGVKNTFKASVPSSNTPVVSRAQLQQKAQAQQKADEKQKAADKAHQKKSMVAAASFASHKHSQKPAQQGPNVAAASAAKRSSIINASGMSIPPAPIPKTPTKSKNAKQNPQPAKPPIASSKAAVSVARKPSKSEPRSKQVRRTERAVVQQPQVPASGPQVATFKPEPLEPLGSAGADILANPGLPHSYRALIGDRDDDFEDGDNDNFEDDILQPVANPNPGQEVADTLAYEEPEHDPTYSDDEDIHNANQYPNIDDDFSDDEHDQGMETTDGLIRTEELEESTETDLHETSFVNDTAAENEELSDDEESIRELAETPAGTKNTRIGSHEPEVIKIDSASTGVSNTGDDGIEPSPVSSNPSKLENIRSISPTFSEDYEENLADSMGLSSPTFKEDNKLISTPQIQSPKSNAQRGVAPQQRQQGPYPSPARPVASGQRPSSQGAQQNQTPPPRPSSAQQIRPPYSVGPSQGSTGSQQQPQRASTMRAQNGTRPQSYQQPRSTNVAPQKPVQRQRPQSLAPATKNKMSPSPAHTAKFALVKDDFPSLAPTLSDSSFDEERARRRKERQAKGPGFSLMSLRSARQEPEDTYSSALPNPAFDRTASLTLSSSRSPGGGFAAAQGLPPRQSFKSRIADDSDSDYEGMVSETFSGLKKKTRRGSGSNGGFLNSLRVSKGPQAAEGTTPSSPGLLPSPTFSKPDDSYGRFSAPNSPVSASKPKPLEYPQPSFIPSVAESPEPPSPQRKRGPLGALFARRQHIVDMQQQRARERKEHHTDASESPAYPLSSGTLAGSNHNLSTNNRPFEPIMEHPPQRSSFVTDEGGSSPRTNVSYPQSQSSQPTIATSTTTPVNTKSSVVGTNDLNAGAKTLLPPVNLDQGALQTPAQVGLADSSKGTVAQAPVPEKTVEAPVKKKRFRLKNMFKKK